MTAERAIELFRLLLRLPPEKQGEVERIVYEAAGEMAGGEGMLLGPAEQAAGLEQVVAMLSAVLQGVAAVQKDVQGLRSAGGCARGTGAVGAVEKLPEKEKGVPVYRIRQESTRRRRGMYDQTEVSTWRVWFGFAEVLLPESVASECLVLLIWDQGDELSASGLTEAVRKSMPGGGDVSAQMAREILYGREGSAGEAETPWGRVGDIDERDVIWDEREIAQCLRRLKELKVEVQQHEAAADLSSDAYQVLKATLEEQQDLLRANAREVKGRWVPKEYRKGTFSEKADAIRKQFRRLLDGYLRQNCRPLFDHLNDKEVLRYGARNWYRPKPRINWEFEFKKDEKRTNFVRKGQTLSAF